MVGRGSRTSDDGPETRRPEPALVRVRDVAGRPRGIGFAVDRHGTLITGHEAVDGTGRLVLQTPDERVCVVDADAVTPLPGAGLALVRTEGLGLDPLPVTVRDRVETGTYVRIAAGGWREARVLGTSPVTYAATDSSHPLDGALELAVGTAGTEALRPGGGAAGGPVLDAVTGAVLAVLGTALHSEHRTAGFAMPLRGLGEPLDGLLARNAETVPAYGADLNLAAVLELTAAWAAADAPPLDRVPVQRPHAIREFRAFEQGTAAVLGLVGSPGSGRTTELAALAARRARSPEPAPVLGLRGADLRDTDTSLADAATRALQRAGRTRNTGDIGPARLARVARDAGRPLLLLLDGPEDMPPALAHRLPEWTAATAAWLRETGARLVVACGPEYWEGAGAGLRREFEDGAPCLRLGALTTPEAHQVCVRHGIPEGVLQDPDARHPLTLRLLAEVRAALPDTPPVPVDRHDVFSAYLDLVCLRIATRLATGNGLSGTAVRRLAARVSGQVHEAARRGLGPGQGVLDRTTFETLFPRGPAPRLGGTTGWASAVLAEGLLVPAGHGYRFAHEELADRLQAMHLDLDAALGTLVHRSVPGAAERPVSSLAATAAARRRARAVHPALAAPRTPPVPRHRIGPVVQALLLLARQQGPAELALRLEDLVYAMDTLLTSRPAPPDDAAWWAAHLLTDTLVRLPDATPYLHVLRLIADGIVRRRGQGHAVPAEFGPMFWEALRVREAERFDLLRRLVAADGAPRTAGDLGTAPEVASAPGSSPPGTPRYLDAVARLLAADPTAVQRRLTRWFDDERPLPAAPHATVATAAQALLHTHRRRALDDLTEALVDSGHRRGDELLAVLAEEEPSAMCRAVDRWAHDERSGRRVAAVTYGLRAAPHARTEADRELLRRTGLALMARPADCTLHGGALALLVRDPRTRARHLPGAVARFAAGDPQLPATALVTALTTHPEPVLAAFRARLRQSGPDVGDTLGVLADATTPSLAGRVAALVHEVAAERPEEGGSIPCPSRAEGLGEHVAAYVGRRMDQGLAARAVLLPLVAGLLAVGPPRMRSALAAVLGAPGGEESLPLRHELLELLLAQERDQAVLDAMLRSAADGVHRGGQEHARQVIHRAGVLLARTPGGAARFDRGLFGLARHVPGFARLLSHWLAEAPGEWAALVGPGTRRMIENLAGPRVPA
ncbi:large Pro/Ala/Gly-rich protein [Streptomyces hygroscopicus]|uniref:serine protease n=1 Tax=Streptomyces hygroscopicus TaxID=1912 RepID=UPI00223EDC1F|nr:serine protease [Streptomyces hygroscopicus]MCW7947440.1 large Pro/Ala/Gly-rich protein [Streptomyces hygroscopicus]